MSEGRERQWSKIAHACLRLYIIMLGGMHEELPCKMTNLNSHITTSKNNEIPQCTQACTHTFICVCV